MRSKIRRLITICFAIIVFLSQGVTVRAENIFFNTLNDYADVIDVDTLTDYYVGYFFGSNDSEDWGFSMQEEETGDSTLGRMYLGNAKEGNTLSASISCMTEGVRLAVIFEAVDSEGNTIDGYSVNNEDSGADFVDGEFVVPEGATEVAVIVMECPVHGGYGAKGTIVAMAEFFINGKATGAVADTSTDEPKDTVETPDNGPEQVADSSTTEVTNDTSSDLVDSIEEPDNSTSSKLPFVLGGAGAVVVVGGGIAIAKGVKGKGGSGEAHSEPKEETYTLKDPTTGAETLYIKDQNTGEWVSSDGSSILNTDKIPEWQQQRNVDRAWQDEANKGVKKPTRFEDIDKKEAQENEQISRETYFEKVAIKHGMDASDMDAVYDKVSHDQARDEVSAQQWTEIANHADTGLKIAENLKTTADVSVSALGAVTGPAGTIVKDLYTAGTTIGGDVSEAVAQGKDAYEIAQTAAGAVTKTAVGVIQNHVTGVGGKATADIAGGAVTGGIDAYVKGENVAEGIATGTAGGILSAGVDIGGEMTGALKDANMASGLKKDLTSAVSDVAGDLLKDSMDNAVSDSFGNTFNDLKPGK